MEIKELKIGDLTARLPIIQGGMGIGVSLSGLASAVADEGGIGTISGVQIGFRELDFEENPVEANLRAISKEIRKARKKQKAS
jgi:NAD(P)H-dependent flavin oxidoreductase YrpB (nitropropane dioxygenase family)